MSWTDLLEETDPEERVLPWYGYPRVHDHQRSWTISGPKPPEHGWFRFSTPGGRSCELLSPEPQEPDPEWGIGHVVIHGYLIGDRMVYDNIPMVTSDISRCTVRAFCVPLGLERFARASFARCFEGPVFLSQEFPLGPEQEVIEAYQDRKESVNDIPGVTPALDLAFRWCSHQRRRAEERRAELERLRQEEERKRAEEERVRKLMRDAGTAMGRRALAARDFETAAREALRVSGAELLDCRQSRRRGEMVVQYRFRRRRLECVVDRTTMNVIDAGVCLTDHDTGEKGDTYFTLESLPGVIGEAMDLDKLVVWRHA